MVGIMVLHVRSKYTAVGRKEIVTFFYLYSVVELLSIFLDSGIIPSSSSVYAVRPLFLVLQGTSDLMSCTFYLLQIPVVRGSSYRIDLCYVLVFIGEWIRWISVRRRWYTVVTMGSLLRLSPKPPT